MAATLALCLAATACHSEPIHHEQRPTGPTFVPSGTLLVDTRGFEQRLLAVRLPAGSPQLLSDYFGQFRLGAAWGPGGVAYSLEQSTFDLSPASQLYRLTGRTRPQPVGGDVRGGSGFAFARHLAVTWTCLNGPGSVFVMDVSASKPSWDRFARGCGAGISPDGRTIAFIRKGGVWEELLDGGRSEQVLSPGDVPQLKALGIGGFQQTPGIALGSEGLAVAAGSLQEGSAIVVVRSNHAPQVVPLGTTTLLWMAWQPKGRLLAFADRIESAQVTEVRTFDPTTGTVREVAVSQGQGTVWSPDGKVLAIFKGASVVAFVDPDGLQLATDSVQGEPHAWKS